MRPRDPLDELIDAAFELLWRLPLMFVIILGACMVGNWLLDWLIFG